MSQPIHQPAEVFPPGEFLAEELEARGISVPDFAVTLGWPRWLLESVIRGEKRVTPRIAIELGGHLGISDVFWSNLQAQWDRRRRDG